MFHFIDKHLGELNLSLQKMPRAQTMAGKELLPKQNNIKRKISQKALPLNLGHCQPMKHPMKGPQVMSLD